MQKDLQPKVYESKYTCASCGSSFEILSTKDGNVMIDVCSHCHPFYVGAQSNTSLRGRAEKLSSKFAAGKAFNSTKKEESTLVKKTNKTQVKNGLESL